MAVIPAFNEARFIGSIVLNTRQYCRIVIVVDDGSTDETGRIAQLAGALVIRHEQNLGKGASMNTALRTALIHQPAVVVMLDADGQHSPAELCKIVTPVLHNEADIVIGSRYMGGRTDTPRHRIWGHRVFNLLTGLASGVSMSDSQSGYRAFSPQAVKEISFQSQGFSVESEMQFLVSTFGLRMVEVPITIKYLDKPKRSVILHGVNVLNGLIGLVGQYRPLLFFGLLGGLLLIVGLFVGVNVVDIYFRTQILAIGYAMISVLLTIIGCLFLMTGFILHSIRGMLLGNNSQFRKP